MRNRAGGFTLLEVIIGVAVLSLIAGLLFQATTIGMRTWQTVKEQARAMDDAVRVQGVLRERLQHARLLATPQLGARHHGFLGEASRLQFLAEAPGALGNGALANYELEVRGSSPDATLILRWQSPSVANEWMEEALVGELIDWRISYMGADLQWRSTWNASNHLPALIRIDLQQAGRRTSDWPPLIVSTRLAMPVNCQFDPIRGGCVSGG